MADHSRFEFANVFTPGAPHPDDDPLAMMDPADIPVYSQNQLDAALTEARNEGGAAATDEAAHNADAQANQILASIQAEFTRLGSFQDSVVTNIHADAVELAMVIGQKLARSLMSREPKAEIEALVLDMLQQHSETGSAPKIMVRVHPVVAPDITSRVETLKNNVGFVGEVTVLPSENLGPTDCSVEWADGGAVRNLKQLEDDVSVAIKQYLGAIGVQGGPIDPSDQGPVETAVEEVAPVEVTMAPEALPQTSIIDDIAVDLHQTNVTQDPVT
jgi:flagellar assembly protein FliH